MKQIIWKPKLSETKELFYRESESESWQHYLNHPLSKPDFKITSTLSSSKGFATAQVLLKRGYKYVASPQSN